MVNDTLKGPFPNRNLGGTRDVRKFGLNFTGSIAIFRLAIGYSLLFPEGVLLVGGSYVAKYGSNL